MFQYSLYEAMRKREEDVFLDSGIYRSQSDQITKRKLEINMFPNVHWTEADPDIAADLRGYVWNNSILKKTMFRFRHHRYHCYLYEEQLDKGYQPEIFDLKDAYLMGYWQCEKYFYDCSEDIKTSYSFPENIDRKSGMDFSKMIDSINSKNSISIHIRRGDYLNNDGIRVYGGICDSSYYKRAIEYYNDRIVNAHYYVFSDDIEWAIQSFKSNTFTIVNPQREWDGFHDLYLMSLCKHHIIANSSYSWWGAWLGKNTDKIVLCPSKWYANHSQTSPICDNWIRI